MNILPKKRWHVRTRDNIARVRKDEAAAAEEEKKRIERIELAEKEARTDFLRTKAREKYGYMPKKEEPKKETPIFEESGHVNLFYEMENNDVVSNKTNAEHEKEAKAEREKEEMKIGYLTYLGQDTNELTGSVSWYNKLPIREKTDDSEIGMKDKLYADPMKHMSKCWTTERFKNVTKTESVKLDPKPETDVSNTYTTVLQKKKKHKKDKKSKKCKEKKKKKDKRKKRKRSYSSDSSSERSKKKKKDESNVDINKLRDERLNREKVEQDKAAAFLARLRGDPEPKPPEIKPSTTIHQKYSSQFNPALARQNFL